MPEIVLIKEVLPAPLCPISATFSPAYNLQLIEFKAKTLFILFSTEIFPPLKPFKIFLFMVFVFEKIGILTVASFNVIFGSKTFDKDFDTI